MLFTPSGNLTGAAALVGTSAVVFDAAGDLSGLLPGEVQGAATMTFAASGALTGEGALSGLSDLAFTASGTLYDASAIIGSAVMTFAAMGALMDLTPPLPPEVIGGGGVIPRRPEITLLRRKQLEEDLILMRFITEFVTSGRIEE